ncbi:matrixin family metalloprotease [Labedella populi]|uniref:Matrixin family metalloprotease n=1 Tax=Labedella populi TaxID=2498850 RepID=A0A444QET6_9MICO|nr:matrixin family metalloprotease [Labedella populi]
MSSNGRVSTSHRGRLRLAGVVSALALAVALVAVPTSANAYTHTGLRWATPNLRIDTSGASGASKTALSSAISHISDRTDVLLLGTSATDPTWKARNGNYGATGWEGLNSTTQLAGRTLSSLSRVNTHYVANTTANQARIRVIWLHELSHGLGLGHVTSKTRVMYTSASVAYNNGVRNLTSDEINGINTLY